MPFDHPQQYRGVCVCVGKGYNWEAGPSPPSTPLKPEKMNHMRNASIPDYSALKVRDTPQDGVNLQ
eukprot:2587007-Amphidinium_carterae.1